MAARADFNDQGDMFFIYEAFSGINNAHTISEFNDDDMFYWYQAILAGIGAPGAVHFKGFIDASTNPNYPAADIGDQYEISVKGKIGGVAGTPVEVGDLIEANVDTVAGNQAAVGANWIITQFGLQQIFEITGSDLAFSILNDLNESVGRDFNFGVIRDSINQVGRNYSMTVINNFTEIVGGNYSMTATGTVQFSGSNYSVTTAGNVTGVLFGMNTPVVANQVLTIKGTNALVTGYGIRVYNSTPTLTFAIHNTGQIEAGIGTNLFLGLNSGLLNTTGDNTTSLGVGALAANTSGRVNVAIGTNSLANNTTGETNVAVGASTMGGNTTQSRNVAVGYAALASAAAADNTAVGYIALLNATSGDQNAGFGASVLVTLTTGRFNSAFGYRAAQGITTGSGNTAIGYQALAVNTTGNNNTVVGYNAAFSGTISGGVFIGYTAGYYETGNNKLFIDNAQRASEADGRIKSLIYGIFDAVAANQSLTINAGIIHTAYLSTYANNAGAVGGGLVAGDWYLVADAVTGSKIIEVVQ